MLEDTQWLLEDMQWLMEDMQWQLEDMAGLVVWDKELLLARLPVVRSAAFRKTSCL